MRKEDVSLLPINLLCHVLNVFPCYLTQGLQLPSAPRRGCPIPVHHSLLTLLPKQLSSFIGCPPRKQTSHSVEESRGLCLGLKTHHKHGPNLSDIPWNCIDVVPGGSCQGPTEERWPQFPLLSVKPSSQAPCLIQEPPAYFQFTLLCPWGSGSGANGTRAAFLFQYFL